MAPKRKEPSSEPSRKSTRVSVPVIAPIESTTTTKSKTTTPKVVNKKSAVVIEKDDEDEDEDDDEGPKAKKVKATPVVVKKVVEKKTEGGVGSIVKDVVLKNEDGEDVSLASVYEKNGIVIFSYPKANTPGCTNQACGYRDIYDEISATGYKVFGLSQDSPKSQLSWKTSKKFQYSLLSDPSRQLLKALGATESKKRCHWIIEKGGKLLSAQIGVKPADDPKNALKFIKAL